MKKVQLILLLSSFFHNGYTQPSPGFKSLRYDEDYSYLKDSAMLGPYEKFKYTRLAPPGNIFISFGGEIRYQYFKCENEDWGDAPPDDDGYILSRLLLHADFHPGSRVRLFTQLQSSIAAGRIEPSPVELNELDLHQVFFDISMNRSGLTSFVLRAGRQELNYGSARLVSVREGPNSRQSFDGVKLLIDGREFKTDVFYSYYVFSKPGVFNDKVLNDDIKFGGIYSTWNDVTIFKNIEVYYLWIERLNAIWNDVEGVETRHSLGARFWGKSKRWQYDFEAVYQFGDLDESRIAAWTASLNTSYLLGDVRTSPSVGLKTEVISGDRRVSDNRTESFNPLFPRGAYFGYAALIGPSNLIDIHPSLTVPLTSRILFYIDYDVFWRYSANDGIYNPATILIYSAGESGEKYIGQQLGGTTEVSIGEHLYVRGEITWFDPGSYIKSMGAGKQILFTGITATLRF